MRHFNPSTADFVHALMTKANYPLRPIVSSCESITYNAAKYQGAGGQIKGLEIPHGRKLASYNITPLFTNVPVDKALKVITRKLHKDDNLPSHTELSITQIVELLDFCLNTTYFLYDGVYYQHTHEEAMGSPVSPLVANVYMYVYIHTI